MSPYDSYWANLCHFYSCKNCSILYGLVIDIMVFAFFSERYRLLDWGQGYSQYKYILLAERSSAELHPLVHNSSTTPSEMCDPRTRGQLSVANSGV